MHSEVWYKIHCDGCGVANWLCDGDMSDLTGIDLCGFFCFKCNKAHSLSEIELDDCSCYEVGLERPT